MAKKTIAEQIQDLLATRAEKAATLKTIIEKTMEDDRTKDAAEQEEHDTLVSEIEAIDKEVVDLRKTEKLLIEKAVPAAGKNSDDADKARAGERVEITLKEKPLEKGRLFAQHAMCIAAAKGHAVEAANLAKAHYGDNSPVARMLAFAGGKSVEGVLKAAVNGGTTQDATWAKPLVEYINYTGDFVEFLRGRTLVGQFGTGNIPALRRIPFNVHIKGQTAGGTGYWVGEGKPKPVTAFGFNDTYHGWYKVAAISVLTDDLIRFSDPSAELLVRDSLAEVLIQRMDTDFIDPNFAGSANVSPASILNGATNTASSGNTADDVRADLATLWGPSIAAKNPLRQAVYLMPPTTALRLSLMRNALGQKEFPDVTINGGVLEGVPVLVSDYIPVASAGAIVALVNASDIYFSDDGQATVDFSNQASIQMLDNPTNDSTNGTATSLVSMFQTDSTALRVHRFLNWSRRRASAVAYLTGVNWGA